MPATLAHPPVYNFASDEIVDDSEPERAEIRKKGRQAGSLKVCSTNVDSEVEILSVPSTNLKTHIPRNRSVIEISDSDTEMITPSVPLKLECLAAKTDIPPCLVRQCPANAEASSSKLQFSPLPVSSATIVPKTLNLSQFAFTNPPIRKKLAAPARGNATATLPSSNTELGRNTSKTLDIPASDLAKISRCISCDLSWTARKTSVQKMAHIKSCAKKNRFTDETIQRLVQKEVANHVPIGKQSKTKVKDSVSSESLSKNTYMDDILVGAAPRKKGKPQQAQTVLSSVSATRGSILERAQTILAMSSTHDVNFATLSTPKHPSICSGSQDEGILLSTQTFGQSALAQKQGVASETFFSAIYSSPIPRTIDMSSDTSLPHSSPDHMSPRAPDILPRAVPRTEHRRDSIQSAGGFQDTRISDSLPTCHLFVPLNEDSVKNKDSRVTISILTPPKKSIKKSKATTLVPSTLTIDNAGIEEESRTPTKRSRTRKGKEPLKKAKVVYSFDDKWESHMMEHILQDTNLYLRMLRYEPIDFNVFLEIAQHYAPLTRKLKLHLRAYLDKKAIHFYDASRT